MKLANKRNHLKLFLKQALEIAENPDSKCCSISQDGIKIDYKFDDEKPKILTAEEYSHSLPAKYKDPIHNENWHWREGLRDGFIGGEEETHKRYKPQQARLKNVVDTVLDEKLYILAKELLGLVIKDAE